MIIACSLIRDIKQVSLYCVNLIFGIAEVDIKLKHELEGCFIPDGTKKNGRHGEKSTPTTVPDDHRRNPSRNTRFDHPVMTVDMLLKMVTSSFIAHFRFGMMEDCNLRQPT